MEFRALVSYLSMLNHIVERQKQDEHTALSLILDHASCLSEILFFGVREEMLKWFAGEIPVSRPVSGP